jgi:chromosomal replication initiator protein
MLDIPYAAIGKKFGQRDHSTIMHSVKLIEDRMRSSREMQEEIEIITKMIRES